VWYVKENAQAETRVEPSVKRSLYDFDSKRDENTNQVIVRDRYSREHSVRKTSFIAQNHGYEDLSAELEEVLKSAKRELFCSELGFGDEKTHKVGVRCIESDETTWFSLTLQGFSSEDVMSVIEHVLGVKDDE